MEFADRIESVYEGISTICPNEAEPVSILKQFCWSTIGRLFIMFVVFRYLFSYLEIVVERGQSINSIFDPTAERCLRGQSYRQRTTCTLHSTANIFPANRERPFRATTTTTHFCLWFYDGWCSDDYRHPIDPLILPASTGLCCAMAHGSVYCMRKQFHQFVDSQSWYARRSRTPTWSLLRIRRL